MIHAGELSRRVELFKETYINSDTSERVKTEVSIGAKFVKRIDGNGMEDESGMLIPEKVARFALRFDPALLAEGEKWFVRDIDGDFHINHISITGPGRNRFLELKCRMRGKD